MYDNNYKHGDGAKVRDYKQPAESHCTLVDDEHQQIAPVY
jgi:hypothetical protein